MEFIKPRELFSPEEQRIYSLQRTQVTVLNKDLIQAANIPVERFERMQRQLVAAGLLEITFDDRPGFVVEAKRSIYRWPEQKADAA